MSMLLRRYHKQHVKGEGTALDLPSKTSSELKALAKEKGIKGYSSLSKEELIEKLQEDNRD